jgi:hypothetical protein
LRGVIEAYRFSSDGKYLNAALRTAEPLVACMDEEGRIAGRLDRVWQPAANYSCLTGIAQIAACWFLLAEITERREFVRAGRIANSFVRRTVRYTGDPNMVGGVKGSFPVNGDYGAYQYLNWAAKFFIDANLLEIQTSKTLPEPAAEIQV